MSKKMEESGKIKGKLKLKLTIWMITVSLSFDVIIWLDANIHLNLHIII